MTAVPASGSGTSGPPLVAHIIFRLAIGGLENGLVNLINQMPVNRYRHAIVCLTKYTEFRSRVRRPDVQLFALHKKEGKDFAMYLRLWRVLRELRPDIVHTRNLGTLDCQFVAAVAGVRHRIHGEHGWDVVDLHGTSKKYRLLRRASRLVVHRYIPMSKHLGGWLQQQIGVPESKITQIYNGVDTMRFRCRSGPRAPLPLDGFAPPGTVVIGHVGRLSPVKDQLTLVRAFIHLLETSDAARQRLRLVLIGDGPLMGEAASLLEQAGASHFACLPGSSENVAELLRGFDIFVLPSLNEGISNTILEAMATGLPVVATNVGGNPELVMDGETGRLCPPAQPAAMADVLRAYIDDPELVLNHGRAGRARAESLFSLRAMVGRYGEVYDTVLADRSSRLGAGKKDLR